MSTTPGRNDPCHCGSGKKYKKCHLAQDEAAHLAQSPLREDRFDVREPDFDNPAFLPPLGTPPPISLPKGKSPIEILNALKDSSMVANDPELRALFREHQTLFAAMEREEKLQEAIAKTEPCEEEFQRLSEDHTAFTERCGKLCSEEPFKPLVFTVEEIETAFQKVGYPPANKSPEAATNLLLKAICFIATTERRKALVTELMALLQRYAEQGRILDARIIGFAAQATSEIPDESNPFLSLMFLQGFTAWSERLNEKRQELLREAGLDVKEDMNLDQMDAWLAESRTNPALADKLQRLIEAHPELKVPAPMEEDATASRTIALLDRADSVRLLLGPDETEPWVPFLLEKVKVMNAKYGVVEGGGPLPPAIREVTKNIFTPERIERLVVELKAYRKDLLAAKDQEGFILAASTISYVSGEEEPDLNVFLVNLCARSIHGHEGDAE